MLPTNLRQEALSRAYVRAVAAQVGVICGRPEDDFGLDLFLRSVVRSASAIANTTRYTDNGPQLDIQLKSSTGADVREKEVAYDLEVRSYNLLREPASVPRVLVFLVLPADEALWLDHSEDQLILRHCAYWMSLQSARPTTNKATVRVSIPRANVFSPQGLQALMDRLKQRLPP